MAFFRKSRLFQKSGIIVVLILASLILALLIYKVFRLVLTLPLLLFGFSLFGVAILLKFLLRNLSNRASFYSVFRLSSWMALSVSVSLMLLSICFTVLNLLFGVANISKPKNSNLGVMRSGRYVKNSEFWKSHSLLGYAYKAGENDISSISSLVNREGHTVRNIYAVSYNIDDVGNRVTDPPPSSNHTKKHALFVGGSFTFGEGLNDSATLPSLFAHHSGLHSFNFGMHGYGPHQALAQISNSEMFKNRVRGNKIDFVFYRFIPGHIARSLGFASWDKDGPCYKLSNSDSNNQLIYLGSFRECREKSLSDHLSPYLSRLNISSEPWTASFAKKLQNSIPVNYDPNDFQTFLAIVKEMDNIVSARKAKFVVLIEDLVVAKDNSHDFQCTISDQAANVSEALSSLGIINIKFSSFASSKKCRAGEYVIDPLYDNHPSQQANLAWALKLSEVFLLD